MNILHWNLVLFFFYSIIFLVLFRTRRSRMLFVLAMSIQMICINGFRNEFVGTDTFRYFRTFGSVITTNLSELKYFRHEPGYTVSQWLFGFLSSNFNVWLVVVAVFIYSSLGRFIYEYSKNYFLSYLLFMALGFWHFSFTGIRQTIAIAIVLYSYKFIINRNLISFVIVMVCATMFHYSAIVFAPMYYLANFTWKRIHTVMLIVVYGVLYVFKLEIGRALSVLYFDEGVVNASRYVASSRIGGTALVILAFLVIGFIINNPLKYPERENIVLMRMMITSFFIQSLSSFSYLFTRLNMFYTIFLIVYIPYLFDNIHRSSIRLDRRQAHFVKLFGQILLYALLVIYYLHSIEINDGGILPYRFYWQNPF